MKSGLAFCVRACQLCQWRCPPRPVPMSVQKVWQASPDKASRLKRSTILALDCAVLKRKGFISDSFWIHIGGVSGVSTSLHYERPEVALKMGQSVFGKVCQTGGGFCRVSLQLYFTVGKHASGWDAFPRSGHYLNSILLTFQNQGLV